MAEPRTSQEMSSSEAVDILGKIKKEMMERRQLAAQKETNKQLQNLNSKISKTTNQQKTTQQKTTTIKFPTVSELVGGFSHASPIFSKDYSTWMKNTIDLSLDANGELERIASKIDKMKPAANDNKRDDTAAEYLDMISDQIKDSNKTSLERLDGHKTTLEAIGSGITRLEASNENIVRILQDGNKEQRLHLARLFEIDKKVGAVGGKIVSTLKRMADDNEARNTKDEFRRSEESKEVGGNPKASVIVPTNTDTGTDDKTSGGVMAAIATMLGLGAMKAFLLRPFKAIGKVVGSFLGMFGKLGEGITGLLGPFGKALKFLKVGPLALIGAVFDFGKGFINAKEILGKGEVTVVDRVRAGTSELIGGIGDLFDWVSKIFGFDTNLGKTFRETWLKITEAPARWAQSIVDWFKNDLFAGIGRGTSLTEIPGKIADNLQAELIKLVNWITDGFTSFVDDGLKVVDKIIDDIKSGFADKIKKPFFNMLNSITNAMFDIVDKFVEIIPDALGGEAARKKMADARQAMMIDGGDNSTPSTASATPIATPPAPDVQNVTNNPNINWANAGTVGAPLSAAPVAGKTLSNVEQMKAAYQGLSPQVVAPVQQNINNAKQVTTNNNFNSNSLDATNQTDKGRILWEW